MKKVAIRNLGVGRGYEIAGNGSLVYVVVRKVIPAASGHREAEVAVIDREESTCTYLRVGEIYEKGDGICLKVLPRKHLGRAVRLLCLVPKGYKISPFSASDFS